MKTKINHGCLGKKFFKGIENQINVKFQSCLKLEKVLLVTLSI